MFNLKTLWVLIVFMGISLSAQTSEHLDNNVSSSALTFFSFKGGEAKPIFENLPHKTCILLSMVNHAGEDFLTRTKISSRKQFSKFASYLHTHFVDFLYNLEKSKDNQEILNYISTAFKASHSFNLRLYFDLATSNDNEMFIKASKNIENIPLKILLKLKDIAYLKVNYACLQSQIGQCDEDAQSYLNQYAQRYLNQPTYYGGLGCAIKTEEERGRYFQEQADRGDQNAQECLNQAAYFCELGFVTKTPEERGTYLQEQAGRGDQAAQRYLNQAVCYGRLGFATKTPEERGTYLQERADQGDRIAQILLDQAAYDGNLIFATKTPEERQEYLQSQVDQGDQDAQEYLNYAAYEGGLGFATKTPEERQKYLQEQADEGDQDAQKYLFSLHKKNFQYYLLTGVFYDYVMGICR